MTNNLYFTFNPLLLQYYTLFSPFLVIFHYCTECVGAPTARLFWGILKLVERD